MDKKIVNGDWVIENGKVVELSGIDEKLSLIETRLRAEKGCFYPDKNFGSHLYTIQDCASAPCAARALQYARLALADMKDVIATGAAFNGNALTLNLIIGNEEKEVTLDIWTKA